MERKNRFTLHIVILSLVLILVDLSTTVECMRNPSRRRISMRRTDSEDSLIPSIQMNRVSEVNSTVTCALSLAERHLEVCPLAWKINQLQELLPHLHSMVTKRLGKREFTFTVYMKISSSAVQLLGNAGQALLRSLGKFVQFLGYVQKLFDATVGGSQILEEPSGRKSLYRKKTAEASAFSEEIRDISSVDDEEVQLLIQKAWSRKCALELLKSDKDLCNVINRINLLDTLLDSTIINSDVLAIKLYSERLNLTDILDAIHDSLVMRMAPVQDISPRSNRDPIYLTSIGNNRKLVNEQGQEVKEVFETSDFKVELMKKQPQDKNENKGRGILKPRRKSRRKVMVESKESFPKPHYRPWVHRRQLPGTKDTVSIEAGSHSEEEDNDMDDDDYDWSYFDIDDSVESKELEVPDWSFYKNIGNLSRRNKKYSIFQH